MKLNLNPISKVLFSFLTFFSVNSTSNLFAQPSSAQTDIIIYSYDRPMQLYALLESIETYVRGAKDIFVISRSSTSDYEQAYAIVHDRFKNIYFLHQNPPYDDLKQLTLECFSKNDTPYILFAVDDIIVKDNIDLKECAHLLEKTKAHGFYLRLGKNLDYCFALQSPQPLPPLSGISDTVFTWQFNAGTGDWAYPNNLDFTLYRKTDLEYAITNSEYITPNSLESCLTHYANFQEMGLCYKTSKIINLPLNIVQKEYPNPSLESFTTEDLLILFTNNSKIDISSFAQVNNKSAHAELASLINFIPRTMTLKEKLIVIVTPSYNNKDWWEWNLKSLINQKYENYYVLITDDCSTDGTGDAIENFIQKNQLQNKVKLTKNKERRGALHNLYTMIHSCPDHAIIVAVDGDDALANPAVLSRLNEVYSMKEIWLTYGQFAEYPSGAKGWCVPMPDYIVDKNAFREWEHLGSHLRTFYAWLFKSIKLYDLLDQKGDFYPMTWDFAIMMPMMEMVGKRHLCFKDEILYLYNNANAISDHRTSTQLQRHFAQVIRAKQRYTPLNEKPKNLFNQYLNEKADMIVFAEEIYPHIIEEFLDSIQKHFHGLGTVYILYQPNAVTRRNYENLEKKFSHMQFLQIDSHRSNFKELLTVAYHMLDNQYLIFVRPTIKITDDIDLGQCIKALEETQAYAFSFILSKENCLKPVPVRMALLEIMPNICAWNFGLANGIWASASNTSFTLYRRNEEGLSYILREQGRLMWSCHDVQGHWANEGHLDKIGLCFTHSKIESIH